MQKHERLCLEVAQDEAHRLSGVLTVCFEVGRGHKPKGRLVLRGPTGTRYRTLECSPRCCEDVVIHTRQWVRREGKEVL